VLTCWHDEKTGDNIDRQQALETIDAALQAVRALKEAIDKDKSLLVEIESRTLLLEVKSLLEMFEAGPDDFDE